MALTPTETLFLITDIILIIVIAYLIILLRSKKKIESEKEERLADTSPPSRMTTPEVKPEVKLELFVPEETTGEKPQGVELKAEATKNEEHKEALLGDSGTGEGKDKAQEELELEDRAPDGRHTEPKISVENTLKLEDELPEDPSSLSTDVEPGEAVPEKAGSTRKKSSRKKKAAKKEPRMTAEGSVPEEIKPVARKKAVRKKKTPIEEGQAAGAPKEVLTEGKTEEGMPESKPLF